MLKRLCRCSLAFLLIVVGFSAPIPAQEKKLHTINLGYSAISGSFAPLWVGFDQGLFTKHGVDLKMAYIQGNRVMLSALTAGEIQLYQGGAEGLIRLVSGGGDGIFRRDSVQFRWALCADDRSQHHTSGRSSWQENRARSDEPDLRLYAESVRAGRTQERRRELRAVRHGGTAGKSDGGTAQTGGRNDSHGAQYLCGGKARAQKVLGHT